jgi:adenine-specific DNA-methyltransferase
MSKIDEGGRQKKRASRLSEGISVRKLDYELTYPGKKPAQAILSGPRSSPVKRLTVTVADSPLPRNRLYAGDNLGILRVLCDDKAVCGQVRLVYIDPPFATGASFESRDAEAAYHDGVLGAAFIESLRERLIVIRELLAADGSIYVHLDDKMAFQVKVIMDEVFGPGNFRNLIVRKKSNRKNSTTRQYGNICDYILFYTKSNQYVFNRCYEEWTEEWLRREYPCIEEGTGRRYKKVPVHAPGLRNGETGKMWKGKMPPPGKHWQFQPSVLDEMDARGEIYWSPTQNPRRKLYFESSKGVAVQDIWTEFRDAHNQMIDVTGYPTEKNLDLLKRIVLASSNEGDLVMDCFSGSGTTLVAAEELGRRWIGVDASVTAIETTLKRLANGSEPMGDFVRGKKKKEPDLFSQAGLLKAGFDLYTAEGITPLPPADSIIGRWAKLFKCSTATPR